MIERLAKFIADCAKDVYPEPKTDLHDNVTEKMAPMVAKHVPGGGAVLDVGCGPGMALDWFHSRGFDATGVDMNLEAVEALIDRGLLAVQRDQNDMDGQWERSFDCVWARHVLEHSPIPYFTLQEFARVLKPGGILYVEVPSPGTACGHEVNRNHYSVMGQPMWEQLMRRAGFSIIQSTSITFTTPIGSDQYIGMIARKFDPVPVDLAPLEGIEIGRAGWQIETLGPLFFSTIAKCRKVRQSTFRYWEIGIAELGTIRAVQRLLRALPGISFIYGNDLPTDPFNQREAAEAMASEDERVPVVIIFEETANAVREVDMGPALDFVFLDGCHCFEHVEADFLAIEPHVRQGGMIAFHDTAIDSQDKFPQWDGKPVQVRAYLQSAGLLTDERPGWKLIADDKYNGVGLTIVQKI